MHKKRKINEDLYMPYILIMPTVILILVIMFFPILRVFDLSFQYNSFADAVGSERYIFLENFINIFSKDDIFYGTLLVTLKWVIYEVVLQLVFGLAVALLLNQTFKGRSTVRAVVFIPWAVSGVLTTMLWSLMYNQHIGVINDILIRSRIIKEGVAWLSNSNTVMGSVILAELWRGIPFFAITMLATLQAIPNEIYESSEIDGCSNLGKFFHIILPYLKQTIIFSTLLRAIWEFNSIDMIFTMTNGGPIRMTTTLPIYMMQTAIVEGNYGYGSAIAVISFTILMAFAVLYLKITHYGREIYE